MYNFYSFSHILFPPGSGISISVAQVTGDGAANAQALSNTLGGYPVQTPYNQYGSQPEQHSPGFPSVGYPQSPAGSSSSALAEAQANAGYPGYPTANSPVSGYPPGTGYSPGASASALAEAQANAGSGGYPGSSYPAPGYPSVPNYPSSQAYPSGGSTSALAGAQATSGSAGYPSPGYTRYPSYSEYPQGGSGSYPGFSQSPFGSSSHAEAAANSDISGYLGGNSASASADAIANTGAIPLYPTRGYLRSSAPTQKEAQMTSSQSLHPQTLSDGSETLADKNSGKTGQEYPYYPGYSKDLSGSSALALAEANAGESQNGQGYPYDGSSAEAIAGAEANAFGEGFAKAESSAFASLFPPSYPGKCIS